MTINTTTIGPIPAGPEPPAGPDPAEVAAKERAETLKFEFCMNPDEDWIFNSLRNPEFKFISDKRRW